MPKVKDLKLIATVSANLVRLREKQGITQYELAKRAGLAPIVLNRIEHGQYLPSLSNAHKIAQALGCRVDDLLIKNKSK